MCSYLLYTLTGVFTEIVVINIILLYTHVLVHNVECIYVKYKQGGERSEPPACTCVCPHVMLGKAYGLDFSLHSLHANHE